MNLSEHDVTCPKFSSVHIILSAASSHCWPVVVTVEESQLAPPSRGLMTISRADSCPAPPSGQCRPTSRLLDCSD